MPRSALCSMICTTGQCAVGGSAGARCSNSSTGPALETLPPTGICLRRSGRALSAENEAQIQAAIEHLEKEIDCLQEVLDSNGTQSAIENSWTHAPLH